MKPLTSALLLPALLLAWPVHAQPAALDDRDLGEVWGQALISLTNTEVGALQFTRLRLDADLQLSANFTRLRLGEYAYASRNGTGADIDLGALRFGRSDAGDAARTVTLTNPYLEFVWSGSGSSREVVGMRLGAEGVAGAVGLQMNSVSGSLRIDAGALGVVDSRNDPLGGKRWDGTSCSAGSSCPLALSLIGGVQAGNADGPSRDFFVSVLKQAVAFPTVGTGPATDTAQAGFWLNWRDRLAALTTNGTTPPNTGKTGP